MSPVSSRHPSSVIIRPVLTEKATRQRFAHGEYRFEVARDATKVEIRRAVEEAFDVRVQKVRTLRRRGKMRRNRRMGRGYRPDTKHAFVTLAEGKIDFFEALV